MSKIKVNEIEKASGSGITVPTGSTFTITDGLAVSSLPTVTVAKGGTNLTSFTAGDLLYATGSTTLAKLAKGKAAQQLAMNAGATAPEWITAGGGAMDLLHTATVSDVSQIYINGYFTSDYDHYKYFYSVYGATDNTDTLVRIMQSGSVVTSSNYWYAGMAMYRASGSTAANNTGDNGANKWLIASSDNTNMAQYPTTGELTLFNPLSTTHNTSFTTTNLAHNSGNPPNAIRVWTFAGQYVDAAASSGVSFQYDGGNINGTIRLYGIKNT